MVYFKIFFVILDVILKIYTVDGKICDICTYNEVTKKCLSSVFSSKTGDKIATLRCSAPC